MIFARRWEKRNISCTAVLLFIACNSLQAEAAEPSRANGPCLMALERSAVVKKARHYPGSTADFTEIVSARAAGDAIKVRWRTSVFMPSGRIKVVLSGTCTVSTSGNRVLAVSYGK